MCVQIYSTPVTSGQHVFVGSLDGSVYALAAHNGSLLWETPTRGEVHATPCINAAGDVLYVGSNDNRVWAMGAGNGSVLWWYSSEGWISSPAIGGDASLFFGSMDGHLYKLV